MSLNWRRIYLTIHHDARTLLLPSPSPVPRTIAHMTWSFSTTTSLDRGPSKSSAALARESGKASSFRTKKLADDIVKQAQPYPLSIWGATSWTQMQMVKMGIPSHLGQEAIEFMFYGQLHQESPKARADFWLEKYGKWSPSRAQSTDLARSL